MNHFIIPDYHYVCPSTEMCSLIILVALHYGLQLSGRRIGLVDTFLSRFWARKTVKYERVFAELCQHLMDV